MSTCPIELEEGTLCSLVFYVWNSHMFSTLPAILIMWLYSRKCWILHQKGSIFLLKHALLGAVLLKHTTNMNALDLFPQLARQEGLFASWSSCVYQSRAWNVLFLQKHMLVSLSFLFFLFYYRGRWWCNNDTENNSLAHILDSEPKPTWLYLISSLCVVFYLPKYSLF